MCTPQRCKNRSPRYLQKRMVPRNAVRRYVREQAAKEPAAKCTDTHRGVETRFPRDRATEEISLECLSQEWLSWTSPSFIQPGRQGGLRGRTRRQAEKLQKESTMRRQAHRGTHTQRWLVRLMAVWEAKERNRSGCLWMRHAAIVPCRDRRLFGT